MIIKNTHIDKKTGNEKVTYTTDKQGWKVVIRGGKPEEVEMSTEERKNRNHGEKTDGKGAVGSRSKQKGKSKANIKAEKLKREQTMQESSRQNILKRKLEKYRNQLRKAKIDYMQAQLDDREKEILRKEKYLKDIEDVVEKDREKLKAKHSTFVAKQKEKEDDGLKKDIVSKLNDIIDNNEKKAQSSVKGTDIKESKKELSIDDKLKRTEEILKKYHSKAYEVTEAEEDEEKTDGESPSVEEPDTSELEGGDEPSTTDDGSEETPEETPETDISGTEDLDGEEDAPEGEDGEDAIDSIPNEVVMIVARDGYNVDANNAYDFYDFISKLTYSNNAKNALNYEYSRLPEDKRKITPARVLFDAVVKKLDYLDKKEKARIESELESSDEEGI